MIRRAVISEDGLYRYSLSRRWARAGDRLLWIMLNPSRADANVDDPTMRRCIGFSRAWGFAALEAVNLYALRTPDPGTLRRHTDPVGPANDAFIARGAQRAVLTILAWGAFPWARDRAERVRELLGARELRCLGLTQSGEPRHPLYAPASCRLRECPPSPAEPECPCTRFL